MTKPTLKEIAEEINRAIFERSHCGIGQLGRIGVLAILKKHWPSSDEGER